MSAALRGVWPIRSLRQFLSIGLDENTPDHVTISRTRRLIDGETHQRIFNWVLERLAQSGLIPFPAPMEVTPPAQTERLNRIVVRIGKQRIAFDISCQATVLNPAPVVRQPVNIGRKKRKVHRP